MNLFTKRVKFSFTFKKITLKSGYDTKTIADFMNELGLEVEYEANGGIDFSLINLNLSGSFKYKLPILFGSIKIYDFYCLVQLGKCESNISGLLGNGKLNAKLNSMIESIIQTTIADQHKLISDTIEENIVPRVNAALKGHNAWDLIGMITGGGDEPEEPTEVTPTCKGPVPLPWE